MNIISTEYTSGLDCRFPLSFYLCIFINTQPLKRKRADRLLILGALILIPCELSPVIPYKLQHVAQTLFLAEKLLNFSWQNLPALLCGDVLVCPVDCSTVLLLENSGIPISNVRVGGCFLPTPPSWVSCSSTQF